MVCHRLAVNIEAFFARDRRIARQPGLGERPDESYVVTYRDRIVFEAVQRIIEQAEMLVMQSGNPVGFHASMWVADWLTYPSPALGGDCMIDWLDTPDRQARVMQIIASLGRCAYL